MRKIRRWVTWRLNRKDAGDGRARPKERGQKNHGEPPNPVFTRDIEALVRAINAQMAYSRQYAARNEHIGGWMLQCDDHGWKIFMELIESWDEAGRQMEVVGNAIQLKASARKNSAVLITLYPPEDGQAQHLVVSGSGGHIPIDERFSLQDAWDLINLALTAGGV